MTKAGRPHQSSLLDILIIKDKTEYKPRFTVLIIENFHQQIPGNASVDRIFQENTLVTVVRCNQASVHEVKLDKLGISEVQIHGD